MRPGSVTYRAVCSIEDPAGKVGRVVDDARDILGQVCVEIRPSRPEAEASITGFFTWLAPISLLLTGMGNVADTVITGSYQTF